jgi:copper chaperone CopZ
MCKYAIEKMLSYQKGVVSSTVDVDANTITIDYNPQKTNVLKIKQSIAKLGYNADEYIRSKRGFNKLPECCKDKSKCGEMK